MLTMPKPGWAPIGGTMPPLGGAAPGAPGAPGAALAWKHRSKVDISTLTQLTA